MDQKELHDLEAQCIQECAPPCTTACPLHVDVRAVSAEISQGDFAAGLQLLKKSLPFPGIIGRICDQPCQPVCKRREAGEAIAIADLERACADLGDTGGEKITPPAQRKQRVAIVGGGLSGLTAAFDLAKKRYKVVIFEAQNRLGGSLWSIPEARLPRAVIEAETALLSKMGVEVRLNTPVGVEAVSGHPALAQLQREFEAVFLAVGSDPPAQFSTGFNGHGRVTVDPVTYATSQPGVFAGGDMLGLSGKPSPIAAMADGRRAAVSIDRHVQRVSLTASRFNEGPYESCLYTDTQGIAPLPVTPMTDVRAGYSRDEAMQEAQRCLQCECMECVKVCEYLARFGSYPRKYTRQIYNNLSIVMGTRHANKLINSCSLCGLCAEVCPTDFDMGALCKQSRQMMVAQNRMPPSAHDFALRDMQFSNSDKFAVARHQPGTEKSGFVFFPGCQLSASAPEQVEQVYAYLQAKLPGVGLMLRCCGAPADWAGRTDLFQVGLAELSAQHAQMGRPRVILACSSCYQIFKTNLPEAEIVSLWELFEQLGLPEGVNLENAGVVAVHDPCSTRYEPQMHQSVRRLLGQLGYQVDELPLSREKTTCCSYGGVMWLANPELAREVVERRIATSPADYVTYCAMCRDFFAARGKRTLHLLDLLFGGEWEARATRRGPGYSQRHENRARLKRKLLKEVWGEAMDGQESYEAVQLMMSDEVQQRLEDRLILVEDIQRVIEYAEKTGRKLRQPKTGRLLAHYRPTSVTYWVEYSPQGDAFEIHNAYSHRMEIAEDEKP
ncbi:MAG: FAD-dependent oxidoreductase [Anaerolineales bacterium]|nr:FAD-dependent oxidoreductase [Anaerolineales bacterium]